MTLGGRSFEILEYILTGDVHKKLSMLMYAGGQKRFGTRKPSGIQQEIQASETEINSINIIIKQYWKANEEEILLLAELRAMLGGGIKNSKEQ